MTDFKHQSLVNLRKLFLPLLLIFMLLCQSVGYSSEIVRPDKQHGITAQVIANLLRQYHFNHQKIDDTVSKETLDLYIESLDRNRLYFLASDIAEFEKYRYTLDDDIYQGNLDPAYIIFNTFSKRLEQRIDYVMNRLKQPFHFTVNEEFMIDRSKAPWANNTAELDELWRKKLKSEALNLKLAGKDPQQIQENLTKRYTNFQKRIEQWQTEDVFQTFMNSLCETFDPHTSYFSPNASDNFNIDMSLSLEGIGAQLTTEDDYTQVVRILPGGPAEKSKKIWANDKIVGVAQDKDGEMVDVIGMRLDEVVQKIRGPKGSTVRLEIIPADAPPGSPPKEISLVRDKIILEERAAHSDTVDFDYSGRHYRLGVITVPTFYSDLEAQRRGDKNYKSTTRDVRKLLREFKGADIDGLIIDLRRNGGGSLQEAIELTGLFIQDGPVVQQKDLRGAKKVHYDPDPNIVYDGPMAVMVDRISASASEIFASAIQDYGRGVIVGSQTYGKGTVQSLLDLERFLSLDEERFGQLKVTIAKFYRITGGTTQHRGVIPDIDFPSIYNAMDFGENKQVHALPWDEISPAMFKPDDRVSKYLSTLRLNSKQRIDKNPEFQYIFEDIDKYKKEQEKNAVSLLESARKAKQEQEQKQKLARVNARRMAKGLKPLGKNDEIPRDEDAPDALLEETEFVVADLVKLSNAEKSSDVAKTGLDSQKKKSENSDTAKIRKDN